MTISGVKSSMQCLICFHLSLKPSILLVLTQVPFIQNTHCRFRSPIQFQLLRKEIAHVPGCADGL